MYICSPVSLRFEQLPPCHTHGSAVLAYGTEKMVGFELDRVRGTGKKNHYVLRHYTYTLHVLYYTYRLSVKYTNIHNFTLLYILYLLSYSIFYIKRKVFLEDFRFNTQISTCAQVLISHLSIRDRINKNCGW